MLESSINGKFFDHGNAIDRDELIWGGRIKMAVGADKFHTPGTVFIYQGAKWAYEVSGKQDRLLITNHARMFKQIDILKHNKYVYDVYQKKIAPANVNL